MTDAIITRLIADQLALPAKGVANTIKLLDEGCTIPFISRYRKELTGSFDEVAVGNIAEALKKFAAIADRKETILHTIEEAGKLTPSLRHQIDECWDATILEDIYLPFKPRRRTRAQIAREKGLEPLATAIMQQRQADIVSMARKFINEEVANADEAISGASDIIAESISENPKSRQIVRHSFHREAIIRSKVVRGKDATEEGAKFSGYFDFSGPLKHCPTHRYLAIRRGENAGILRVDISPETDFCINRLVNSVKRGNSECAAIVENAAIDSYKRLIKPSIETEIAAEWKEKADCEAIAVFGKNLRQLLLAAPFGPKRVMAIDPGFRTGCKVVCLDEMGQLLHHTAIFPHPPRNLEREAAATIEQLAAKYHPEAIAIGNGTAGRETEAFVRKMTLPGNPTIVSVSEDGASVYSASKLAREEFPTYDVTVRGAVSIGRRLMDPLAELVKIDPKSIGVGQYQHDVDQTQLRRQLDAVVESCVNAVGVNLNTASPQLLAYVSGLGPTLAKNIVDYRNANGPFKSRKELLKVPRLGPTAFQQCAGFLRIAGGSQPLDNTAVHPESYKIVEQICSDHHCSISDLCNNSGLLRSIDITPYVTPTVGLPTLTDIINELEKPGRDPRKSFEAFQFNEMVTTIESLREGMILPGIVTNITKFGVFVDIGVHHDGLVHISQLSNRFVADPLDIVSLHSHVTVKVTGVDLSRKRIELSMKNIPQNR